MDTMDIQRIIRSYNKQLYANKSENVGEPDGFLDTQTTSPKLNHDGTGNVTRPIIQIKIKAILMILSTMKSPEPDDFTRLPKNN